MNRFAPPAPVVIDLVGAEEAVTPPAPPSELFARLAVSRAARASLLRTEERELQSDLARLRSKATQPNG